MLYVVCCVLCVNRCHMYSVYGICDMCNVLYVICYMLFIWYLKIQIINELHIIYYMCMSMCNVQVYVDCRQYNIQYTYT